MMKVRDGLEWGREAKASGRYDPYSLSESIAGVSITD